MNVHDALSLLRSHNVVLQKCATETCEALWQQGVVRSLAADQLLYTVGEPAGVVLLILRGQLQMSKVAASGRQQVLCKPLPASCGGLCMLALPERSVADIRAIAATDVLVVRREHFQELARRDPALCQAGWQAAAECMVHLSDLIEALSFRKVSERVAQMLLDATAQDGDQVRLTQAQVAAAVGTTREVVARCLASMQMAGLIRLGRGRIAVLRREALQTKL